MGYGTWLHGEAVAIGIQMATVMAFDQKLIVKEEVNKITKLLKKASLPVKAPENMDYACFIEHMKRDKKVRDDRLRFVLPCKIGAAKVVADITTKTLQEVIKNH